MNAIGGESTGTFGRAIEAGAERFPRVDKDRSGSLGEPSHHVGIGIQSRVFGVGALADDGWGAEHSGNSAGLAGVDETLHRAPVHRDGIAAVAVPDVVDADHDHHRGRFLAIEDLGERGLGLIVEVLHPVPKVGGFPSVQPKFEKRDMPTFEPGRQRLDEAALPG